MEPPKMIPLLHWGTYWIIVRFNSLDPFRGFGMLVFPLFLMMTGMQGRGICSPSKGPQCCRSFPHHHLSSILFGDTIEKDYILLLGYNILCKNIILLGSTTKKHYSLVALELFCRPVLSEQCLCHTLCHPPSGSVSATLVLGIATM